MIYTTVEKVNRILSSSQGKRVRTSSTSVKDITPELVSNVDPMIPIGQLKGIPNSNVIVDPSKIVASDDFSGSEKIHILFTNASNYNVYRVVNNVYMLQGSGQSSAAFTTVDGMITIEPDCVSGTIQNGTLIKIELQAHISNNDMVEYIEQTEYLVDNILGDNSVGFSLDNSSLVFEDEPPEAVKIATAYMAAFYIYTDIFADVQANVAEAEFSYAFRWRKRAETTLEKFCRWRSRGIPTVVAFPNIVTQIGVEGQAGGVFTETDNVDAIVAGVGAEEILNTENQ